MAKTIQSKGKRRQDNNSDEHDSSPPAKRAKSSTARKSTGGRPPKPRVSAASDRDDRGEGPSARRAYHPHRTAPGDTGTDYVSVDVEW